jgi:hypothetical protein
MKRIGLVVSALAASLLMSALPVLSAEETMGVGIEPQQQKDECLLIAKNCSNEVLSVQQMIDKLNAEIAKGTNVYTVDELSVLNNKLDNAYKTLEFMQNEGY